MIESFQNVGDHVKHKVEREAENVEELSTEASSGPMLLFSQISCGRSSSEVRNFPMIRKGWVVDLAVRVCIVGGVRPVKRGMVRLSKSYNKIVVYVVFIYWREEIY